MMRHKGVSQFEPPIELTQLANLSFKIGRISFRGKMPNKPIMNKEAILHNQKFDRRLFNMKKTFFLVTYLFILCCNANMPVTFAGSNAARISCKSISKNGRAITLKGVIPATEFAFDLVLSDGRSNISMTEDAQDNIYVIEAFEHNVFTITVARKDRRHLLLYAIPKTIIAKKGPHVIHAKFNAILMEAPKPGYSDPNLYDSFFHEVKMVCTYDYEI